MNDRAGEDPTEIWASPSVRHVLDSMSDGFGAFDREVRVLHLNRVAVARRGLPYEEMVGRSFWDIYPELRVHLDPVFQRAFNENVHIRIQFEFSGRNAWFEVDVYPVGGILHVYTRDVTDRTKQEQERDTRERSLRALVDGIPAIAWAERADGTVEYVNDRWYDYFGSSAIDSGIFSWTEYVHPDDQGWVRRTWGRALETQEPFVAELRLRQFDGQYRWHLMQALPVPQSDGSVHWFGSSVDIQIQRDREETLRFLSRLGEKTRTLSEPIEIAAACAEYVTKHLGASRGTYGEVAEDGNQVVVQRDYCQGCRSIVGTYDLSYLGETILSKLLSGQPLVISDTDAEFARPIAAIYREYETRALLAFPLIKQGRLVAIFTVQQTTPRRWTEGELDLVGMVADRCWSEIERAHSDLALRRSEQRLRAILDISTVGVVVNNPDGTFLYANPPLLRMLGYTEEDVQRGELSWHLIQAPDLKDSDDIALDQIRRDGFCAPYETEYISRDGQRIPVYVGAAAVPDGTGKGFLGTAFITDMRPLKEAQRELVALNSELDLRVRERTAALQRANEAMSDFTYHIAHDLRAPLRAIIATSRMLQMDFGGALPEEAGGLLERQISSGNKLGTLIDELLKLSRLDQQVPVTEAVDVSALAREVAQEHGPDNERVVVEIQEGLTANADPRLLRLLLGNLVSNALRYSPDGGTVTVGREETERGPAFFVRDQGIGFDMAFSHKLFKPFERLVNDADFPGTGVGLANVARIVVKHRGEVWAESELGKGSTFFFTLGKGKVLGG